MPAGDGVSGVITQFASMSSPPKNLTRKNRVPNGSKKNGKRGKKGSLCPYLNDKSSTEEKALSLTNAVRVSPNDVTVLLSQLPFAIASNINFFFFRLYVTF